MNLDELTSMAATRTVRFGICGPTVDEFNLHTHVEETVDTPVIHDGIALENFIKDTFNWNEAQLVLLGGRPESGKTTFAARVMRYALTCNLISSPLILDMRVLGLPAIMPSKIDNADFIVVDYIQLFFKGDGSIKETERMLYDLSRNYLCPVLVLSQLPYSIEMREDYSVKLSDVVDAGLTESLYDDVILLQQEDDVTAIMRRNGYQINVRKSDIFN